MSEQQIHIALNTKTLGNTRAQADDWAENAIAALNTAPPGAHQLLNASEVTLSSTSAVVLLHWCSLWPRWSPTHLVISEVGGGGGSAMFVQR